MAQLFGIIHRNPLSDFIVLFFAKYFAYFLVVALLVLILREKGWRRRLAFFAEAALALILSRGIVTEVIRFFYHRPRPFAVMGFAPLVPESGWSFPSGHAAFFFALALTVFLWDRRWGWWYLAAAVVIGAARVLAGVHWPTDVIAGAAVGLISGAGIHRFLKPHTSRLFPAKQ